MVFDEYPGGIGGAGSFAARVLEGPLEESSPQPVISSGTALSAKQLSTIAYLVIIGILIASDRGRRDLDRQQGYFLFSENIEWRGDRPARETFWE